MFRKILTALIIAIFILVANDAFAGKYKSSSSKSSFSNRSSGSSSFSSKPRTTPPSQSTRKWDSSTSNTSNSASNSAALKQQQDRAAAQRAYDDRQRALANASRERAAAEQRALAQKHNIQKPQSQSSSYASTYSSSTKPSAVPAKSYSSSDKSTSQSYPNNTTTIIRERDGFDVGDALVGAAVMSMLTNNSQASTSTTTAPSKTMSSNPPAATVTTTTQPAIVDRTGLPTVRMCTGPQDQQYHKFGHQLAAISTKYNLELLPTAGSIENISKLGTVCDVTIIQRDSLMDQQPNGQRVAVPYADVAMMFCAIDSGVTKVSDIRQSTRVALPPTSSGSYTTFQKMTKSGIQFTPVSATSTSNALWKMHAKSADCVFAVGTPTSDVFDVIKAQSSQYVAVDIKSSDLSDTVDPTGKPLYFDHKLTTSDSFNIKGYSTIFGFRTYRRDAYTIAVPNDVVISNKLIDNNSTLATSIMTDLDQLSN